MTDKLREEFWDRVEDTRAGMLSATNARAVPMSHYADQDTGTLWFITADGTDLAKSARTASEAQYIISSTDEHLHARIDGTLTAVTDPAKLDELWNAFAAAWFEDGKQDDDIQLLRMDIKSAEVWTTGGNVATLYQIAKANLTGAKPDIGENGVLTF